jgi:hypothetical protein
MNQSDGVRRAMVWREEALMRHHDRASFDCGVSALNEYLQRYARQNHESGGGKTFVAAAIFFLPPANVRSPWLNRRVAWRSPSTQKTNEPRRGMSGSARSGCSTID